MNNEIGWIPEGVNNCNVYSLINEKQNKGSGDIFNRQP